MIKAEDIIDLNQQERKSRIVEKAKISNKDNDLQRSRKLSDIINSFIVEYFEIALERDFNRTGGSVLTPTVLDELILKEIKIFKPLAINELKESSPSRENIVEKPKNVYQLAGAVKLSAANTATRNLSTTMGLLWERIANISPYTINPESEFDIAIKGVDLISKNINNCSIEYQQLKTQRNTLTGSQKERSIAELSLHKNPVFCTCFALGNWTFNHPKITRVSGPEFWQRIGIDYNIFEENVKALILELEETFISL